MVQLLCVVQFMIELVWWRPSQLVYVEEQGLIFRCVLVGLRLRQSVVVHEISFTLPNTFGLFSFLLFHTVIYFGSHCQNQMSFAEHI